MCHGYSIGTDFSFLCFSCMHHEIGCRESFGWEREPKGENRQLATTPPLKGVHRIETKSGNGGGGRGRILHKAKF